VQYLGSILSGGPLIGDRGFWKPLESIARVWKAMAEDQYDRFLVPFGKTYRGKEIRQCRDKPWLLWTMDQRKLVEKVMYTLSNSTLADFMFFQYPVFFQAAQNWVDNPRKYEVTRDVGASEYMDDLNLNMDGSDAGEDPTTSDEEFVVADDEPKTEVNLLFCSFDHATYAEAHFF
jgi:hypothetical protein